MAKRKKTPQPYQKKPPQNKTKQPPPQNKAQTKQKTKKTTQNQKTYPEKEKLNIKYILALDNSWYSKDMRQFQSSLQLIRTVW